MLRTLVLVALLASPARSAFAGACATPDIPTTPLTKAGTELAKGGGVVVSTEDATKPPKWRFTSGDKKVDAKPRAIGAGLVVLEPPAGGAWTLVNDKGAAVVAVKHAAAEVKPLAAPKLVSITRESMTGRRGTYVTIDVLVDGAPPASAVALVVLDDKGAVRSFGSARLTDTAAKQVAINVFRSGSCTVTANGTVDSNGGDKVGLAWVDDSGRMSAVTRATVAAANRKPSPGDPD